MEAERASAPAMWQLADSHSNREADRGRLCKGVDSLTGQQCTNQRRAGYSIDGSPRCTKCYKAANEKAYTTLLRERHDALPQCAGTTKKGMACKCRINEKQGILAALRRNGTTVSGAREAMQTEASIQRIVVAYDKSGLCVWCFKRTYTDLGRQLTNLTTCDDDAGSCQRVAVRNGLCAHHHGLTLPASETLCAGENGEFSCESGLPRKPSTGNLCKKCFDAMTTQMAAERTARPPNGRGASTVRKSSTC
jgi:hypothetical protein